MTEIIVTIAAQEIRLDSRLTKIWDKIKGQNLIESDSDRVYCVDGREGSGKSVFAIQQAAYLDPTIIEGNIERICFTAEEFLTAIRKTESGKVIVFDEAFRGLSSRGALSKTNKMIVQAMMEMRQKNLIVFIVLPTFFMLDLYVAMLRSNALFHISKEKVKTRRTFKGYNYKKKAKLYQDGVKKGWEYKIPTRLKGHFYNNYPGGKEFELKYRAKKLKSLEEVDVKTAETEQVHKDTLRLNYLLTIMNKEMKISSERLAKWMNQAPVPLARSQIGRIIKNYTENTAKTDRPRQQLFNIIGSKSKKIIEDINKEDNSEDFTDNLPEQLEGGMEE